MFGCLFIYTSFRTIHLDSRTECARCLIGFQHICQQTRTTGYNTIRQRKNIPIFQQENPKYYVIAGGLDISHHQSNKLEHHCQESTVVGRLLGETCMKHKSPLKKVTGWSTLSYNKMSTLLTEVQGVINIRPLTYVYKDKESVSHPLTLFNLIYDLQITASSNSQH